MVVFWDVKFEGIDCMLKSISEDFSGPIIPSAFLFIDNMNKNSQFTFVGVVFKGLNDLRLWDILVLDT